MKVNRGSTAAAGDQRHRRKCWHQLMAQDAGKSGEWLRTGPVRALIAVALAFSLLLGGAFLLVDELHSSPTDFLDHPVNPVTDVASEAQVVTAAKQIVTVAALQPTSAGYLLMSCRNRDAPPYQGAIYLTFALTPDAHTNAYFREIAAVLATNGWAERAPRNEHVFGKTLSKDAVTAIIYRHRDNTMLGVLRLYGQCRNMNDHRNDTTAWIDITDQFDPAR